MKFKSLSRFLRFLPLVVGSAAAGVLTSMAPAKALVFNVGGTNYDVTTVTDTYYNVSTQLQATPWWGNPQLSEDLAFVVGSSQSLGQSDSSYYSLSSFGEYLSPFFAYAAPPGSSGILGSYSYREGAYTSAFYADIAYTYAVVGTAAAVPFDIPGGATIPAVGSLLALGAMRKARKSIASKTRTANPVVAVRS